MKLQKIFYYGKSKATGGRDGRAASAGGDFDMKLSMPRELGGTGSVGTNPEELFAAGYAACFLSAMRVAALQSDLTLPYNASVTGIVAIGQGEEGFGLDVELQVSVPNMDKSDVRALTDKAHSMCPYSNATRGNIDVKLTLI